MWKIFVILICISAIAVSIAVGYFICYCFEKFTIFMADWIWNEDKEKEDFE